MFELSLYGRSSVCGTDQQRREQILESRSRFSFRTPRPLEVTESDDSRDIRELLSVTMTQDLTKGHEMFTADLGLDLTRDEQPIRNNPQRRGRTHRARHNLRPSKFGDDHPLQNLPACCCGCVTCSSLIKVTWPELIYQLAQPIHDMTRVIDKFGRFA
ncbi:uncharacterized protein BP01DRAFT_241653 [Aspergillus saccharolyticus JOP 1030-1]|uniref:Uncharacterized protein n=1 Tax=Aspergillus saccharolyticus JOP 1030-1 TaxID=1450539 RepID=A0A318ZRI2_9EURO|nr:hypothetical protein BP01DRAFT_241653 [Aspergillus saccharolyticus JOP 1030-1]PYH46973.1 hypothetical protein BP01DRAFT_241653 [Aspergillus saccharolyticus JOP 1030-1]